MVLAVTAGLRITAPHFVVGVLFEYDRVVKAAPIVKYMYGWNRERVENYSTSHGWTVEEMDR